jgi:DNA repair protein RadA/Sms
MAKTRTQYVCQQCGSATLKWMGRCPDCGEWNTLVEVVIEERKPSSRPSGPPTSRPERLTEITSADHERLPLPIGEFSRVLGGGVVPGSLVLIGGDPGIGKSTLLTQVAGLMAEQSGPVLYVSGEESTSQIKMRADRLDVRGDQLYLLTETNLDHILDHIQEVGARVAVIDSIQTVYLEQLPSTAGSVSQVRECAARLQGLAKSSGVAVFLVGHVTKEGAIAGPRVLEHIVDVVLYLEGDRFHTYRLLRGVKNRFGATSEVGVFEMQGSGMIEVPNPSEAFLAERMVNAPGSAIAVTMEGTRPLLVEIQALASGSSLAQPRRTPNGIDFNRLLLISAVLTKRCNLRLSDQDLFVNVVGGMTISEPAADLSIALAIASSVKDRPVAADLAAIGEVGLSGEVRAVGQLPLRLQEAANLGFRRCLVPRGFRRLPGAPNGVEVVGVRSVAEAIELALI